MLVNVLCSKSRRSSFSLPKLASKLSLDAFESSGPALICSVLFCSAPLFSQPPSEVKLGSALSSASASASASSSACFDFYKIELHVCSERNLVSLVSLACSLLPPLSHNIGPKMADLIWQRWSCSMWRASQRSMRQFRVEWSFGKRE